MKKSHKHTALSTRVCVVEGCGKRIKQRLVELSKKTPIDMCYKHFTALNQAK